MALFAPIGPARLLRKIGEAHSNNRLLGKYHLVLAHDIVANKDEWEEERTLPPGSTVIIDNSIIELGKPVDIEMLIDAYMILGSAYKRIIVLPDKFDDPDLTFANSMECLLELKTQPGPGLEGCEFMYVIQGDCLADFNEEVWGNWQNLVREGCNWFAVPRRVCDNFGTRMVALYPLMQFKLLYPEVNIHLLGFSENVLDDVYCAAYSEVHGIDSAVPVRLGQQGKSINLLYKGDQAGPRGSFWEDPHDYLNSMVGENLLAVRVWFEASHKTLPRYTPTVKEEKMFKKMWIR